MKLQNPILPLLPVQRVFPETMSQTLCERRQLF